VIPEARRRRPLAVLPSLPAHAEQWVLHCPAGGRPQPNAALLRTTGDRARLETS
jgi:hypothetical protein